MICYFNMLQRWIEKSLQKIHPVCVFVFFLESFEIVLLVDTPTQASRLHQSAYVLHLRAPAFPYISTCPLTFILTYFLLSHISHKIAQVVNHSSPSCHQPPLELRGLLIMLQNRNLNRLWRADFIEWNKERKGWEARCLFSELQLSVGVITHHVQTVHDRESEKCQQSYSIDLQKPRWV